MYTYDIGMYTYDIGGCLVAWFFFLRFFLGKGGEKVMCILWPRIYLFNSASQTDKEGMGLGSPATYILFVIWFCSLLLSLESHINEVPT